MKVYRFWLLLGVVLFTAFSSMSAQEPWKGNSIEKCFTGYPPPLLEFENTAQKTFYDFTVSIKYKNGTPLDFALDTVTVLSPTGKALDFGETDSLGFYTRIETSDKNDAIQKGDKFKLRIRCDPPPNPTNGDWCVVLVPTTAGGDAVAARINSAKGFGVQQGYVLSLDPISANFGTYPGIAFGDVNLSGFPIDTFFLNTNNFFPLNAAFVADSSNVPLPGSFFDPITGKLAPPFPILPGEPFFIHVQPAFFPPNIPMEIALFAPPAGPVPEFFVNVTGVDQNVIEGQISNQGEFTFDYFAPLTSPEFFLNLYVEPLSLTASPIWVAQNIMMLHFDDTMRVNLPFPLTDLQGLPTDRVDSLRVAVIVTDTIVRDYPPSFPVFYFDLPVGLDTAFFGGVLYDLVPTVNLVDSTPPIQRWDVDLPRTPIIRGVQYGCEVPNLDLDSSKYRAGGSGPYAPSDYAGDWNACVPTATSNSFSWMRKLHSDLDQKLKDAFGEGDSAHRKMQAELSDLMSRANEKGVKLDKFIEGKLSFIDKYKLPIRVGYQTIESGRPDSMASPNNCYNHQAKRNNPTPQPGQTYPGVTPDYFMQGFQDSCDIEFNIRWLKRDSAGNITAVSSGGHCLTATGISQLGSFFQLWWKDDKDQSKTDADSLRNGVTPLIVGPTGLVYLPGLNDGDWEAYLTSVVQECYDPTVNFRSVKGSAFRDPTGSGSSGGSSGGVGGVRVFLLDSLGNRVDSTATHPDGTYTIDSFFDVTYRIEVELPPGLALVPKDVGNDSTDSDIDPLTFLSDTLIFPIDTTYTIDFGLVVPGVDLWVWLEGPFDPVGDSMRAPLLPQLPPLFPDAFPLPDPILPPLSEWPTPLLPFPPAPEFFPPLDPPHPPVDWGLLGLLTTSDTTPIVQLPVIVLTDGYVTTPDYQPIDWFRIGPPILPDSAFLILHMPGHLPLMSPEPLPLLVPIVSMDLRLMTQAVTLPDPRIQLPGPGVRLATPSGDTNNDGVIDAADRANTWNQRNQTGYLPGDTNRDGAIDAADRANTWNNRNKQTGAPTGN